MLLRACRTSCRQSHNLSLRDLERKLSHLIDLSSRNTLSGSSDSSFQPQPIRTKVYSTSLHHAEQEFRKHIGDKGFIPPSLENLEFQDAQMLAHESDHQGPVAVADLGQEDSLDVRRFYEPGSYMEISKLGIARSGVVLGEAWSSAFSRWFIYLLSSTGELLMPQRDDISFVAPNFVSADLAARCGQSPLSTNASEHAARIAVLKHLRKLSHDIEEANGAFNPDQVDLYSALCSPDPTKWAAATLSKAMALVKPRRQMPDLVFVIATHRHLMSDGLHFVLDPEYRLNETFHTRPRAVIDRFHKVQDWLNNPKAGPMVPMFVKKCKNILEYSKNFPPKKTPKGTPTIQYPSVHPGSPIMWSEDDKALIRFLIDDLMVPYPYDLNVSTMENTRTKLVRKVFPKLKLVDEHALDELLRTIGIVAPWDNYNSMVAVRKGSEGVGREKVKKMVDALSTPRNAAPTAGQALGPYDLHKHDPLDSVRHDFGDLPVYVVDDADAIELDDGFSIERVANDPDSRWVHVHVADPGSVIHPNHVLATEARKKGESRYFLTGTVPLFPNELMHSGTPGMSLREGKDSQRVLTFSAKVDKSGQVKEYKVQGGIIRNTRRLLYDGVDLALGNRPIQWVYPFGRQGKRQPQTIVPQLNDLEKRDFEDASMIAGWLDARRIREGIWTTSGWSAFVDLVDKKPWPTPLWEKTGQAQVLKGLPEMEMTSIAFSEMDKGTRHVVAEMMKIASHVASMFLRDARVPIIRRGSSRPVVRSEEMWNELLALRDDRGYVPQLEVLKRQLMPSSAGYSTDTVGHFALGIRDGDGYSRCTSPLRRYMDLVTHWQIHSVLLKQRKVFDQTWMEYYAQEAELSHRSRRRENGAETWFWNLKFIKRWIESQPGRGAGRLSWEGVVCSTPMQFGSNKDVMGYDVVVTKPQLGLKFKATDSRGPGVIERLGVGSVGKFKPDKISFGTKPTMTLVATDH